MLRLVAPLPLKKFIKRRNPKTILSFNFNILERPDYSRSIAGISFGYNWNSTKMISLSLIPVTGDFVKLNARSVHHIIQKGGTILKSARSKEFRTIEGRKKAYDHLVKENIDALVLIGGDGTFTGGMIFQKE